MELRHLRTFLAVAETLNVSEAARRLRVTQPALSRQIKDLEWEIGYPLFVRRANGLRLTDSGATFQAHAGKVLAAAEAALHEAKQAGEAQASVLRVGYYSGLCVWANILGRAFERLGRTYPKATTKLFEHSSARLASDVSAGTLDAALLGPGEFGAMPGVVFELACTVPAVALVAADHPLAKKRILSIEDLRGRDILSIDPKSAPGRENQVIASAKARGFEPRIVHAAAGVPELMVAITKRSGLAIADAFALLAPVPGIAVIRFKPSELNIDIHAAYANEGTPASKLLVSSMLTEARRAGKAIARA